MFSLYDQCLWVNSSLRVMWLWNTIKLVHSLKMCVLQNSHYRMCKMLIFLKFFKVVSLMCISLYGSLLITNCCFCLGGASWTSHQILSYFLQFSLRSVFLVQHASLYFFTSWCYTLRIQSEILTRIEEGKRGILSLGHQKFNFSLMV